MASLEIHFLDVGQGDGTFIIFPNGETALVDLGSKKNGKIAGGDAIKFIKDTLQKKTIEYLFLTHGDADHYNLIPQLNDAGYSFSKVFIGGAIKDYDGKVKDFLTNHMSVHRFSDRAHDKVGTPEWTIGAVEIYLLSANNPVAAGRTKTNSSSLVLMLKYMGCKVILTGDAEDNVEQSILNYYQNDQPFLKSDALKLGHHGSKNATSKLWLDAVQPKIVLVSADMKWSHPYCEVYERVLQNTKLSTIYQHEFVCGTDANTDYTNRYSTEAICCNMVKMYNSGLLKGLCIGIQYLFQIEDSGKMYVGDANQLIEIK